MSEVKWVALDEVTDEIIACGDTIREVYEKAREKGFDDPVVTPTVEDEHAMFF